MGSDSPSEHRSGVQGRILIFAPVGRDGPVLLKTLAQAGVEATALSDNLALGTALDAGVDALLLTQEALSKSTLQTLDSFLEKQPAWLELPLIVLLDDNLQTERAVTALRRQFSDAGLTVLQRPVRATELVSAVQVALRARSRQYELGEYLANQQLLIREVNHRVKNALASVLAIYEQTLRRSETLQGFAETFQGRLLALNQIHSILASRAWDHVDLREIAEATVAPYRNDAGDQIKIRGKGIPLSPKPALTLAMCLHELATNGAKYGAFLSDRGSLVLEWKVVPADAGKQLHIRWREQGGPKVTPPKRRGFGTRFIETSVAYEVNGTATIDFAEDVLDCQLVLPLSAVLAPKAPPDSPSQFPFTKH